MRLNELAHVTNTDNRDFEFEIKIFYLLLSKIKMNEMRQVNPKGHDTNEHLKYRVIQGH